MSWTSNQHIRIFLKDHVTLKTLKIQLCIMGISYILKYIWIESICLNCDNISQYCCLFNQINVMFICVWTLKVLAGSDRAGCVLEHVRHRLGQVCMEQCVCAMDPGSVCVCSPHATFWYKHSPPGTGTLLLDSWIPNKAVWKSFMEKTKITPRNLTLYDLLSFAVCFSPDRLWAAIPSPPSARHQQPIECLYRTTYPGTDCNWCTVMYLYFNEWSFSSIFTGFIYDYCFFYILSAEVCF